MRRGTAKTAGTDPQRIGRLPLALALGGALLSGCGDGSADDSFRDGTYTGTSSTDEAGAYGEATITLDANDIVAAEYATRQADGTIKDEEYGKANGEIVNEDFYDDAQDAVAAMQEYAEQLVEVDDPDDVDVVSGATISYRQFVEAVTDAMDQARE